MNNIPEKILELVSMFCTYFGIIFMVAAPPAVAPKARLCRLRNTKPTANIGRHSRCNVRVSVRPRQLTSWGALYRLFLCYPN